MAGIHWPRRCKVMRAGFTARPTSTALGLELPLFEQMGPDMLGRLVELVEV